jgi:hypothetical protein
MAVTVPAETKPSPTRQRRFNASVTTACCSVRGPTASTGTRDCWPACRSTSRSGVPALIDAVRDIAARMFRSADAAKRAQDRARTLRSGIEGGA